MMVKKGDRSKFFFKKSVKESVQKNSQSKTQTLNGKIWIPRPKIFNLLFFRRKELISGKAP